MRAYERAVQEAVEAQARAQAKVDAAYAALRVGADLLWYTDDTRRLAREALVAETSISIAMPPSSGPL